MRFGDAKEWAADLLNQVEDGNPILVARKHAVEPKQIGAERGPVHLEHADQRRRQFVHPVRHDEHAGQHLLRAHRVRLDIEPQLRCFEGDIETAGVAGNLDGPLKHARVARAQGQIRVGLGCQVGITQLQGHFGDQHLEYLLPALINQLLARRLGVACHGPLGLLRRRPLLGGRYFIDRQRLLAEQGRQRGEEESASNVFHGILATTRTDWNCLESFAS